MTTEINNHYLVPTHEILDEEGAKAVLMKYGVDRSKLPKILKSDAGLDNLAQKPKIGDVIKITRKSQTAGVSIYYRVVIE